MQLFVHSPSCYRDGCFISVSVLNRVPKLLGVICNVFCDKIHSGPRKPWSYFWTGCLIKRSKKAWEITTHFIQIRREIRDWIFKCTKWLLSRDICIITCVSIEVVVKVEICCVPPQFHFTVGSYFRRSYARCVSFKFKTEPPCSLLGSGLLFKSLMLCHMRHSVIHRMMSQGKRSSQAALRHIHIIIIFPLLEVLSNLLQEISFPWS